MLGKRFKFEMKSRINYLIGVSVIVLIMSLIFSFVNNRDMSSENGELISGAIIAFSYMAVNGAVFFLLIQTVNRFNKTFLGNEGYLIHTLPVKGTTHIIADFIADFIQVIISVALLVGFYFIDRMANADTRSEFRHNLDVSMKDFYHSGSNNVEIVMFAVIFFLTVIVVILSVIWVMKLGINFSKNLVSSNNRAVPIAIAAVFVIAGVSLTMAVINFAQKSSNNRLMERAARINDASLTEIYTSSLSTVLLIHIAVIAVVVFANIFIINKKLNLQ